MLEHRCRSGKHCVARAGEDPAVTAKPDSLCVQCIDHIQDARNKLVALQDAVRLFIGIKPVTVSESKVAGSKEPSSPLNLAAETLTTDIDEVLSRIGGYLIRDLVAQPAAKFKVWRGECEQIVFWDGVTLALQVRAVHDRAVKLLGFERQWRRRSAPCWSCRLPCLGQLSGSETVECSNCGERKTEHDYHIYCFELAKGK